MDPLLLAAVTAAVATLVTLLVTGLWKSAGKAVAALRHRVHRAAGSGAEAGVQIDLPMVADNLAVAVTKAEGDERWRLRGEDRLSFVLKFAYEPVGNRNAEGAALEGHSDKIARYFEQLCPKRLVITGGAGSGKTVLAIELIVQLLKARKRGDPVPVRVSLSGWNPDSGLEAWLAQTLVRGYGLTRPAARILVGERRVLPVLDGLDELSQQSRRAAFGKLNEFRDKYADARSPLVVTCRDKPDSAHVRPETWLLDSAMVCLQPVSALKAGDYLSVRDPGTHRWDPVIDTLEKHPEHPLSQALHLPLWLTFAASSADPEHLRDLKDPAEIDQYLLGGFVAARTRQAATGTRYAASDFHQWLDRVAKYLTTGADRGQGGPRSDIVLHELWVVGGARLIRFVQIAVSAAVALASTIMLARVMVGTPSGWLQTLHWIADPAASIPPFNRIGRIAAALMFFLVPVIAVLQSLRGSLRPRVFAPFRISLRPALAAMAVIVVTGALSVIALSHKMTLTEDGATVFPVVILGCLAVAAFFGLKSASARVSQEHVAKSPSPKLYLRCDATAGLVNGIILGILTALALLFSRDLSVQPVVSDRIGLATAIPIAFTCGFLLGFLAMSVAWTRYVVMAAVESARGRLPLRPATFFDHALAAGLLRLAGPSYQFRHQALQKFHAEIPASVPNSSRLRHISVAWSVPLAPAAAVAGALILAITMHGGARPYLSGPARPPCHPGTVCNSAALPAPLVVSKSGGPSYLPAHGMSRAVVRLPAGTGLYIVCYRRGMPVEQSGRRSDIWVWVNWTSETAWAYRGYIPVVYIYSQPNVQSYYHVCSASDFDS